MYVRNKLDIAKEIPDLANDTAYFVEAGGVVEVPNDLGASLLEQVDAWEKAKAPKASDKAGDAGEEG